MPFQTAFETHVNENMKGPEQDRSSEAVDRDVDLKKPHPPSTPVLEVHDMESTEKKERPPRFSTLFDVAPPPIPPREFDSYPPPKRKSGIYVPTWLCILFILLLLFESTVLFAYTVIGLYNNLPSRLIPTDASGGSYEAFGRQPAVNIAPNFVIPQAQALFTQTVTALDVSGQSDVLPASTSTSSLPSVSTSSTPSSDAPPQSAAIASGLLAVFGPHDSSSSPPIPVSTTILTEGGHRSTILSTQLITVDPAGSTIPPRPTVTRTTVIAPAQTSVPASPSSLAERSDLAAPLGNPSSSASASSPPSITLSTFQTSTAPPTTPPAAPATSSASAGSAVATSASARAAGVACFGGSPAAHECV